MMFTFAIFVAKFLFKNDSYKYDRTKSIYNHIVQSCLMLPKFNKWLVSALSEWNLQLDLNCKTWVIPTLRLLAHWFKYDNPKVVTV